MSTLTKDQWDELQSHIARAKAEINEAAGILAEHNPESPWEKRLDDTVSMSANEISGADFWCRQIMQRLAKEARECSDAITHQ